MIDITSQLEEFGTGGKPIQKLNTANVKQAIIRAGDIADAMRHGFKHGKKRGETTHFKAVDKHLKWKPGFLYCITGWPQHGKTEFSQFLAILKAFFEGKKWAVHSPENYPAEEFFDTLAHTLVGLSPNPYHHNQMTDAQYEQAIEFLHEHFFYVYQEGLAHTPAFLREAYSYIHAEYGLFGTITDPWNKVAHLKNGRRDDEYLQDELPMEQKQARELDIVRLILAHPKSPGKLEKGQPLPIPDQYWLAGGQMWDNMCDVIGCTYRPNYHIDKKDTAVQWHTHKMKKQNLMGLPGSVDLNFDRFQARYFDLDGNCPLVPVEVTTQRQNDYTKPSSLPASTFDEESVMKAQSEKAPF